MRIPKIIVTNETWSRFTTVAFEDEMDNLIGTVIPSEWIDEKLSAIIDQRAGWCDEEREAAGPEPTRDQIESEMAETFERENDTVDESWPDRKICRVDNYFYSYDDTGNDVKCLGEYNDISEIDLD